MALEEDVMSLEGKTITELTNEMAVTKRTVRYHLKQIGGGKHKNENGVIIVTPEEIVALYERIKGETLTYEQLGFKSPQVTQTQPSDTDRESIPQEGSTETSSHSKVQENEYSDHDSQSESSKSTEDTSSQTLDSTPEYSTDKLLEAVKYLNDKVKDATHQIALLEEQLSHRDQLLSERDKTVMDLQEQLAFYHEQMATQHKIIDQEQQLHLHTKQLLDKLQEEKLQLEETTRPKGWFTRWFIGG